MVTERALDESDKGNMEELCSPSESTARFPTEQGSLAMDWRKGGERAHGAVLQSWCAERFLATERRGGKNRHGAFPHTRKGTRVLPSWSPPCVNTCSPGLFFLASRDSH